VNSLLTAYQQNKGYFVSCTAKIKGTLYIITIQYYGRKASIKGKFRTKNVKKRIDRPLTVQSGHAITGE